MKKSFFGILAAISLLAGSTEAQWVDIGSGPDTSYLVIESPNDPSFLAAPLQFAIHYTFDTVSPQDGYWLLQEAIAFDASLSAVINNFGSPSEPNYFMNSMTYDLVTLTNTVLPATGPYWQQWVAGGEAGFPTASPVPSNSWTLGSGISAPYRALAPGSTDGFVFAEASTSPSVSPVPEPSSFLLLVAATVLLIYATRRRVHTG
jgi:hypothetical protein